MDALDLVPENDVLVAGDVDVWEVLGREFGNQEMEYVHVTCVSNLEWGDLKVELITEEEATQNWDGEQLLACML